MRNLQINIIQVLVSGALLAAPALLADETGPAPSNEEALALAEKAWQRIQEADAVSLKYSTLMETKAEGMNQEMETRHDVFMEKPNRFAMIARQGQFSETFVSDGEKATFYFPMAGKYYEQEAPPTVEDLFKTEGDGFAVGFPARAFLAPFFSAEAFDTIREQVGTAEYVGREEIGDGVRHRLAFHLGGEEMELPEELAAMRDLAIRFEVDLRSENDEDPLVERIHIDMTEFIRATMSQMAKEHPEMAEMFRDMEMRYTFSFADWRFPESIDAAEFAYTPPATAERVDGPDDLFDTLTGGGSGGEPHELLGQPAPAFELTLLDGSPARLEDHLGEKVIVLDFWATWCGPCIQAMPVLMEVTEKYRDQGVVFWAINLRESQEQVRNFVAAREWELAVPMDSNGAVGDKYKVSGIPQTVIIGKDGTVQAVHIGFSPKLRETLPVELETLLAGQSLLPGAANGEDPAR